MDLTKYSKGKRMVREDKIKLIDELKKVIDQANAAIEELKEDVAAIPVVAANPILEGTEPELEGLEIGSTKYAMPSGGGDLYLHTVKLIRQDEFYLFLLTKDDVAYDNNGWKDNMNSLINIKIIKRDISNQYIGIGVVSNWIWSKEGTVYGLSSENYATIISQSVSFGTGYLFSSYGGPSFISDTVTKL